MPWRPRRRRTQGPRSWPPGPAPGAPDLSAHCSVRRIPALPASAAAGLPSPGSASIAGRVRLRRCDARDPTWAALAARCPRCRCCLAALQRLCSLWPANGWACAQLAGPVGDILPLSMASAWHAGAGQCYKVRQPALSPAGSMLARTKPQLSLPQQIIWRVGASGSLLSEQQCTRLAGSAVCMHFTR